MHLFAFPLFATVLAAALHAIACLPAPAQTIYQTPFDSPAGWTLDSPIGGVGWAVDSTPSSEPSPGGPFRSGSASLNYNNGTDFNTGAPHNGSATSPSIDLAGSESTVLRLWCNYRVESEVSLNPGQDQRRIYVSADGFQNLLLDARLTQSGTGPAVCDNPGTWHEHVFDLNPAWGTVQVRLFFNAVDATDNAWPGWFVDDLSITGADPEPPAAIQDLQSIDTTTETVTLQWTAPGDDGMTGTASSYGLRYSTNPILDDTDFDAATPVTGVPAPGAPGSMESFAIGGLNQDTVYYFAIRTTDDSGQESGLSNVAEATTDALPPPPPPPTAGSDSEEDGGGNCSSGVERRAGWLALALAGLLSWVLHRRVVV